MLKTKSKREPAPKPCILIDTREQKPFSFGDLDTTPCTLLTGDYSLSGWSNRIAIERKSLDDFFNSLTRRNRERFEAELGRLAKLDLADVIVEADFRRIQLGAAHCEMHPNAVTGSVMAYRARFPRIHWWFCPSRSYANGLCRRLLLRYWEDFACLPC